MLTQNINIYISNKQFIGTESNISIKALAWFSKPHFYLIRPLKTANPAEFLDSIN